MIEPLVVVAANKCGSLKVSYYLTTSESSTNIDGGSGCKLILLVYVLFCMIIILVIKAKSERSLPQGHTSRITGKI